MMSELLETVVEDLKDIVQEIGETPELPVDSSENAGTIDLLLTDVMNRLEKIIEDLERE